MLEYLNSVAPGLILAVSAADETGLYWKTKPGLDVVGFLEKMGSKLIASVGFRDSLRFCWGGWSDHTSRGEDRPVGWQLGGGLDSVDG